MTILTLSASSFLVSYLLIDEILTSSIRLGINQKTGHLLSDYQKVLKKLKVVDPENKDSYKAQFYEIQEAMVVYQNPEKLVSLVKKSYLTYFIIIFISILTISIFAAFLLTRKVSLAYKNLYQRDLEQSKRLSQLEYFDNWQQIAASLAHEIKNPLTPIELMVSNLTRHYKSDEPEVFQKNLDTTKKVVLDEVSRLKMMVNHFSRFSKLPEPDFEEINFVDFLKNCIKGFISAWDNLEIGFSLPQNLINLTVYADKNLLKQCLLNLIQNALQANPSLDNLKLDLRIELATNDSFELYFVNKGKSLSDSQRQRIFQVGFTSRNNKENQGLGLSIVKKIILDHHGDIETIPDKNGTTFRISLPFITKK